MFETKEILRAAQGIAPYLTETYRLLHRHPEVAHREAGTNRLLRAELEPSASLEMVLERSQGEESLTVTLVDSAQPKVSRQEE